MRTTLDLPHTLLLQAQQWLGVKTKTEAIIRALQETVRWRRLARTGRQLAGKVPLPLTHQKLSQLRRRRVQA